MSKSLIAREPVRDEFIEKTRQEIEANLEKALAKKGGGSFASVHEIYGALSEEVHEVLEEIHNKDLLAIKSELLDIAIVSFWGVASINQKIKSDD